MQNSTQHEDTLWMATEKAQYHILPNEEQDGRLIVTFDQPETSLRKVRSSLNRINRSFTGYMQYRLGHNSEAPAFDRCFPYVVSTTENDELVIGLPTLSTDNLLPLSLLEYERMEISQKNERWLMEQLLGLMAFAHNTGFILPFQAETFGIDFEEQRIIAIDWINSSYRPSSSLPTKIVQQQMMQLLNLLNQFIAAKDDTVARCLQGMIGGEFSTPIKAYEFLLHN